MKHRKIFLSFLLALAMVVGLMPGMSLTAQAADEGAYTDLLVTTDMNKSKSVDALKALQVTFNGRKWYIIEDESSSATSGTVTLLSADTTFGIHSFNPWTANTVCYQYSTSEVKIYLDSFTQTGGDFADVAEAIETVNLTTNKYNSTEVYETVNGVKLYLLSTEEASLLSGDVRKAEFVVEYAGYSEWWLRSPGENIYKAAISYGDGDPVWKQGYGVEYKIGVRPALKLNLSKVTFDSETKTFNLSTPAYEALTEENKPTITVSNDHNPPQIGDTLTAATTATDITYSWHYYNSDTSLGEDNTYTVTKEDLGKQIVVTATQNKDADGDITGDKPTQTSEATTAVVKKTPATINADTAKTNAGISYSDEKATPNTGYEISTDGNTPATLTEGSLSLTNILDGEGKPVVYVRTAETDDTAAGAWVEVSLARPAAPTNLTTDKATNGSSEDGKINGATAGMEYKLKDSTDAWKPATATATTVKAGTYLVRTVATSSAFAGKTTEVTVITAATDDVIEKINALPYADKVTTNDKDAIEAARAAYDALPDDQKKLVSEDILKKLTDDEDALAVAEVNGKINALPSFADVTTGDKDAIKAARAAYDALTDDQKAKISDDTLKKLTDAEDKLEVLQAMSEVSAKTGSDVVYTGNPIQLINVPTTKLPTGYKIVYAVTTENTVPTDESLYTTDIPSATNAGTYYVWYKVIGDDKHNDTEATSISVTISMANTAPTNPSAETLNYTGAAQPLVTGGSVTGGELQYALGTDATNAPGDGWSTDIPTAAEPGTYYVWYRVVGDANHNDVTPVCVVVTIEAPAEIVAPAPEEIASISDYTLLATMKASGKKALKLSWTKVADAEGYDVFFGPCGGEYALKTTVTGRSCKIGKLKKGIGYKAYVRAWKTVNGAKTYIGQPSPSVHAIAGGKSNRYTNPKKITVKKKKLSLKAGASKKIKASVKKLSSSRRYLNHTAKIRYYSSNRGVATVDANGRVSAVGSGSCTVYALAENGLRVGVKITVK